MVFQSALLFVRALEGKGRRGGGGEEGRRGGGEEGRRGGGEEGRMRVGCITSRSMKLETIISPIVSVGCRLTELNFESYGFCQLLASQPIKMSVKEGRDRRMRGGGGGGEEEMIRKGEVGGRRTRYTSLQTKARPTRCPTGPVI